MSIYTKFYSKYYGTDLAIAKVSFANVPSSKNFKNILDSLNSNYGDNEQVVNFANSSTEQ
jgi:hypothetical protein